MIKYLFALLLISPCVIAQRTPVLINGAVVNNPNFKAGSTATFSVSNTNVTVNPTNIANAQIAAGAAIDVAKLSGVAASATQILAGNGISGGGDLSANRTVTWAPSLWTSAGTTFGDASQATMTWTFNLSAGTLPVVTATDNSFKINVPLSVGTAGTQGRAVLYDADASNSLSITPAAVTTTDVNAIFPAAPFTGLGKWTASGTTNFTLSLATAGTDYQAPDNWTASGTTNSTLAGNASVNGLVAANTATLPALYGSDGTTRLNVAYTVYAAGTAYQMTATPAALTFGTTSPSVTLSAPGTYAIRARVNVKYNAATFAANRTLTLKLRRTNNTAADLTSASDTFTTRVITTVTDQFENATIPEVIYTTSNSNDAIAIFGDISVVPTAGSLDATSANIVAVRLYE